MNKPTPEAYHKKPLPLSQAEFEHKTGLVLVKRAVTNVGREPWDIWQRMSDGTHWIISNSVPRVSFMVERIVTETWVTADEQP